MKRAQNASYLPPVLPEYLKNVYDLKPIVGSPNDDEVKGIQAVIRAAQNAAQIPGMFDSHLSMSLAQHLFEVQMARYRDKYPCSMFPEDMVHTPPTLPSHATFTLEPVVGVPSDEELQAAQSAVRRYEQMAIFPSMFDPTISMELSQHLFNIQLECATRRIKKGDNKSGSAPPSQTRQPSDVACELSDGELLGASNEPNARKPRAAHQAAPSPQTESTSGIASLQARLVESNERLTQIADTLEGVKQGIRGFSHAKGYSLTAILETMNNQGQVPTAHGLPLLVRASNGTSSTSQLSNEQLARYLQFYDLGGDLVHPGDTPTIQNDKRRDAEKCLLDFINHRIRPT